MAEYNPRQLTKDQYSQLKDSITRFGLVDPLIVNKNKERKNILVGGHQRFKIAKEMGIDEIPCVEVDLTLDAEKELNIRLNKNVGEWDYDALANYFDVGELTDWGFSNDELQFYEDEPVQGLIDDDEIPEVEEAITKEGDLWILGDHRVLCGDATKKEDVDLLMDGRKADICFTSPPYNLNGSVDNKNNKKKMYVNSDDNLDEYTNLLSDFTAISLKKTRFTFVNLQGLSNNQKDIFRYVGNLVETLKDVFIWNKKNAPPNIQKGSFGTKFEYIFCFSKDNHKGRNFPCNWQGKYFNVIDCETNNGQQETEIHRAGFPIALPIWILEKMDFAKSLYEPFLGTGTTLIACEKTNRKCYGMEIDPHYCDVIVKRWEDFTGKKAERIERVEG